MYVLLLFYSEDESDYDSSLYVAENTNKRHLFAAQGEPNHPLGTPLQAQRGIFASEKDLEPFFIGEKQNTYTSTGGIWRWGGCGEIVIFRFLIGN